jgi:hypothetical protein
MGDLLTKGEKQQKQHQFRPILARQQSTAIG